MAQSHHLKPELKAEHLTLKNIQNSHQVQPLDGNKGNIHRTKLASEIDCQLLQKDILVWFSDVKNQ